MSNIAKLLKDQPARPNRATSVFAIGPIALQLTCIDYPEPSRGHLAERMRCVADPPPTLRPIAVRLVASHGGPLIFDAGVYASASGGWMLRHDITLSRTPRGWEGRTLAQPVAIEGALRWISAVELLSRSGLLLHACSAMAGGAAHLFLGPSGAGKTTIAAESDVDAVLCDEVSIIAREESRWWAYPSPFWGLEECGGRVARAPIAGLWQLAGRDQTCISAMRPADGLLAVYRRVIDIGAAGQAPGRALQIAGDLVDACPVGAVSWRRGDPISGRLQRNVAGRPARDARLEVVDAAI